MKMDALMDGAWLITPELSTDERGFFARIICVKELSTHSINGNFVQASLSYNRLRGTVRGMHFQWPPSREAKLVRCVRGSVHDILLDLRPGSSTYLQHVSVNLDDARRSSVYIPPGVAHGFQTLTDDAEVEYHMTDYFRPEFGDGFRWSDPAFSIRLPLPVSLIAERDAAFPDFDRQSYEIRFRDSEGILLGT